MPACAQKGKPIITVLDFTLDEVSEAEMLETETARTLSAAAGDDLETLYDTWETAQQVATEGNANRNFILGASLAGAGIALSTVSLILFAQSSKDEGPEGTVAILPGPFVSTLRFSIRF